MASSNSDASPPSLRELLTSVPSSHLIRSNLAGGALTLVSVLFDQSTGSSLVTIEGSLGVHSFLYESQRNQGQSPETKASIEALPRVRVSDPGLECSICLSEYGEAEVVKQMPCKHMFHGSCIDRWLGTNPSCPVCRFRLPVDDSKTGFIIFPDPGMGPDQVVESMGAEEMEVDVESLFGDVEAEEMMDID